LTAAERFGYDTLWVADRLLRPLAPRSKYPATPDRSLPEIYQRASIPLKRLTDRSRI